MRAIVIPRSAFPDDAGFKAYYDQLSAATNAMGGEREAVRALLHDMDALCPSCKYNLRNSASDRCSECARQIELNDLLRAMIGGP